jgi:anti-sigma B factor antagonist
MKIVELKKTNSNQTPHVIHMQGRLDANQVAKNKSGYIAEITSRKLPLVLNLSEVSFIDSTGLGFLIAIQQAQADVDEAFVICALTDKTRLLLELTRLNLVFDIHETETMAVEALTRPNTI